MSTAFGTGWLERVIRNRFRVAGPQPYPLDLEAKAQVSIEARPSLPWEYGNARWLPVGGGRIQSGGGAGTFAKLDLSVVASGQRAFVVTALTATPAVAGELALHVNQVFVVPAQGVGLLDGRYLASGSWLTPVSDAGISSSTPGAVDPQTNAVEMAVTAGNVPYSFSSLPLVIMPGQTISVWTYTANIQVRIGVSGLLVPIEDMGS